MAESYESKCTSLSARLETCACLCDMYGQIRKSVGAKSPIFYLATEERRKLLHRVHIQLIDGPWRVVKSFLGGAQAS